MKKQTYSDISAELQVLCDISYDKYSSHSFVCGTLHAMLALVVADLPASKQAEAMDSIRRAIKAAQSVAA